MFVKVLCIAALVAVVSGQGDHKHHGHHEGHSEQHFKRHDGHPHEVKIEVKDKHGHVYHDHPQYAHSHYDYGYKVEDKHTGDNKHVKESRDGHEGHSEYSQKIPHPHHH